MMFHVSFADGTAKLSGRDYEFRESTRRREPTVRSEDLSGEIHVDPGESQSTETTDNAEVCADFWSIQGDFIYHHHIEPRVQLYVPKEETFLIPLKNIDVNLPIRTDLVVLQKKRLTIIVMSQTFVRFLKRIYKVHFIENGISKRIFVVGVEIDKDSNDFQAWLCMARSMDKNW